MLNEVVRIADGYYMVTNTFMMPHVSNWDIVFSKGQLVSVFKTNEFIEFWDTFNDKWVTKDLTYKQMTEQSAWALFKPNVRKLDPNELPNGAVDGKTNTTFMTTVKNVPIKARELGIDPGTKVKVTPAE